MSYIGVHHLVELKLAAGRARDRADVVELIRTNPAATRQIRQHVVRVHPDYGDAFDDLEAQSDENDR